MEDISEYRQPDAALATTCGTCGAANRAFGAN